MYTLHAYLLFCISHKYISGIEDKLITTAGYCILITDEGAGFLKDLKNKDSKHESDIVLINQLYDGEGDKVTLAQNKQRVIPRNSTSVAISLQQEAFVNGIFNLGSSLWIDSGFSERFMVTAVKPFRLDYFKYFLVYTISVLWSYSVVLFHIL